MNDQATVLIGDVRIPGPAACRIQCQSPDDVDPCSMNRPIGMQLVCTNYSKLG